MDLYSKHQGMNAFKKLSIIIPVYNEKNTIAKLLSLVNETPLRGNIEKEIIMVNDGCTDGSKALMEEFLQFNNFKLISNDSNQGKGACIKKALEFCSGELIMIQDGDLEYDPNDINLLLEPFKKAVADVVYGSRFIGGKPTRKLFCLHNLGNKFLTFMSNMFTNLNLTDMECCYKIFNANIIRNINLKENRFGFEPEVTAKIAKIKDIRIYEVGVGYFGRTYAEGKKIKWTDGIRAVWAILKYNIIS